MKKNFITKAMCIDWGTKFAITVISFVITILVIVMGVKMFVPNGWINQVEQNSMNPTLKNHQIIFSEDTNGVFNRGDIVISYFPETMYQFGEEYKTSRMVKRVIAVPGDHIVIDKNNNVFINGRLFEESLIYLPEDASNYNYKGSYTDVHLNENEYFLMGDNRKSSTDSRIFGPVTYDKLIYQQSEHLTTMSVKTMISFILIAALGVLMYSFVEEIGYTILSKNQKKN